MTAHSLPIDVAALRRFWRRGTSRKRILGGEHEQRRRATPAGDD
jgi:hypothetical protein